MAEEQAEQIGELLLEDEMRESYLTYAMSVIMSRALPDVRDGLKPSQRRILLAMNDLNLGPRSKHRKCAKIAGDTSGNYHPHGEGVIYPTLVRMAQSFAMRYPLVDGQGNFGSIDGDPAAAMRYTEARMARPAVELLEDLKLQTVDFQPNYDETLQEPIVLPGKFPNLLVNGSTGIAVGMATNIPPHNVGEICDALIKLIGNPDTGLDELCEIVRGPDFPTGGTICGREGILQGYKTGRASVVVHAKHHIEQGRSGRTMIVVDEIPYQILKTTISERAAACVKNGTITDIADIRDESDRKGMRLVIELKRDANVDIVINQLYRHTPLQTSISIINIALVNRQPRTLNLKQLLGAHIDHRKRVIRRRTAYLLKRAQQRAHVLEGLILAVAAIDEVIELIRTSADPKQARQRLMEKPLRLSDQATLTNLLPERFVTNSTANDMYLTVPQANAILAMQLQRLTGLEMEKLAREYSTLCDEIEGYQAILADDRLVLDIIREDVHEIKDKYGDPRRTVISDEQIKAFNIEDLIPDEEVVVTATHSGYVKRVPIDSYRKQGRGGRGVKGSDNKEGDWLEHLFVAGTHDHLLFFTNRGRVYSMRVYDLPSMSRTSKGRSSANILKLQPEEEITLVLPLRRITERFVVMATRSGRIKKTPLAAFANIRSNGIIAISLTPNDALIGVQVTSGKDELILSTREGISIRFSEQDVRAMGRGARGVRGIRLRKGDQVVDMAVAEPDGTLLTVCEQGFGKRTAMTEYRHQGRGGFGTINIKTTGRNGKVVAAKTVRDEDELMLITANGIVIRFALHNIRPIGRNTQGVRMIRVDKGDKLVAVARVVTEAEMDKSGDEKNDHSSADQPNGPENT